MTPPFSCRSAYWSLRSPGAAHSEGLCGCPSTSWSELTQGFPSRSSKSKPLSYGRSDSRSTDGESHFGSRVFLLGSLCCLGLAPCPFAACMRPQKLQRRRLCIHKTILNSQLTNIKYLLCILLLFIRSLIFGSCFKDEIKITIKILVNFYMVGV